MQPDPVRDVFTLALRLEQLRQAPIPPLRPEHHDRDGPREGQHPKTGVAPRTGAPSTPQRQAGRNRGIWTRTFQGD